MKMIYQRGPDGYPIGASEQEKREYGIIPEATEFFHFKTNKYEIPEKIIGWQFSTFHYRWGAVVKFHNNRMETYVFPKHVFIERDELKTDEFGW